MARSKKEATRPAHPWTLEKLDFLEKYIPAFLTACNTSQYTCFVDGFAGPGTNIDEKGISHHGSPLIALNASGKPPTSKEFDTLYFVELAVNSMSTLRQQVETHSKKSRVRLYQEDFNAVLPEILNKISPRTPTLFLLDPEDMSLKWSSVQQIGQRQKADLFILISASGVHRNVNNPDVHSRITEFFGSESWRTVQSRFEGGEMPEHSGFSAFLELYTKQLHELGFTTADYHIIARNSRNAAMHGLVFAGKHPAALSIANDILRKIVSHGQQPLGF